MSWRNTIFSFFFVIGISLPVSAEEQQNDSLLAADFNNSPTYITSDTLTLKSEKNYLLYEGNVKVLHQDMNLVCDEMEATYSDSNEIQEIIAKHNVFITKGPNIQARGEKAVYDQKTETIILSENPEMLREGSVLTADRIKIFLKEDRSVAEGEVRVKLVKKEEAEDKGPVEKNKAKSS